MTFAFLTINFRRPQVFRLFCASIKRLREEIGIEFPVVCVSEKEDALICSQYYIEHIIHPNNPASEKWNVGCEYLQKLGLDYVVTTGSDDIWATITLRRLMIEMDKDIDLIGFNNLYIYNADGREKELKFITSRSIMGVGRTINKRILDAVNWRPWGHGQARSWGMDAICSRTIAQYVRTKSIIGGIIVDCKTRDSLNKFSMFQKNRHGMNVDKSLFYNILSKEELEILNNIKFTGLEVEFPRIKKKGRILI